MKKTKVLIPALSVLALGMAASVTGTVAWFTTTAIANANGMQVTSVVPSSLYIDDTIFASSEGVSLDSDSVTHSAHATPLNPAHMAFASDVLTAKEPLTYVAGNEVGQGMAGIGATFANKVTLTGSKSGENKAALAEAAGDGGVNGDIGSYFAYYPESIIRKQTGNVTKFSLNATITVSGVDKEDGLEKKAYETIRVGFLYTVNDGEDWFWSTRQQETVTTDATTIANTRNTGRPATDGDHLTGSNHSYSGLYCENWNFMGGEHSTDGDAAKATPNEVFVVVPVIWLEGEDSNCYAINFQNAYNWTVSIQYKIAA